MIFCLCLRAAKRLNPGENRIMAPSEGSPARVAIPAVGQFFIRGPGVMSDPMAASQPGPRHQADRRSQPIPVAWPPTRRLGRLEDLGLEGTVRAGHRILYLMGGTEGQEAGAPYPQG